MFFLFLPSNGVMPKAKVVLEVLLRHVILMRSI